MSSTLYRVWLLSTLGYLFLLPQYTVARTLVLNDTNGAPFTTEQHDGFLDIVAGKAFKAIGIDLVLTRDPAERGLRNADDGINDGELTRIKGIDKIYNNLLRVPEKLVDWDFVAFSKNQTIKPNSWHDLKPYHIGHIRGWKILEANTVGFPSVEVVSDSEALFSMLERDRIDVALFSRWSGLSILKQKNMRGVRALEPPLATREMYIYLNKKHEDLVPLLADSLKQIKASGEYERLFKERVINTVQQ